jgi:hypothetical protein
MFFSEFEGNNWAKIACGDISSQALSACLAESQFRFGGELVFQEADQRYL